MLLDVMLAMQLSPSLLLLAIRKLLHLNCCCCWSLPASLVKLAECVGQDRQVDWFSLDVGLACFTESLS